MGNMTKVDVWHQAEECSSVETTADDYQAAEQNGLQITCNQNEEVIITENIEVLATSISNGDFISAIFNQLPEGSSAAVCSKSGDPENGSGWYAQPAGTIELPATDNNYSSCSSFKQHDGEAFSVRKDQFGALHCLMLDDLGTKIPFNKLGGIKLSWRIETSPGNYQGGLILAEPITDYAEAERLTKAINSAGYSDAGSTGPTRWFRLPNAINGKEKYWDADGNPFKCRLDEWHPERRYTKDEIDEKLDLVMVPVVYSVAEAVTIEHGGNDVLTPRAIENPVITTLKNRGLCKTPLGSGKFDISCPWRNEHTDGVDSGTAFFEPDDIYPTGGFKCLHAHCSDRHIKDLLEFLGISNSEARHKPVIRIVPGEIHRVVDAAERQLAQLGKLYQSGGLIVTVTTDPVSGDPSVLPLGISSLTRQLSVAATWEKFDARLGGFVRCDPPARHVSILNDAKTFQHLPPLAGVTRQPYFRDSDGELVTEPGYDDKSKMFGVFNPREFIMPGLSLENARNALALLEELLTEFHFVSTTDKAAALAAIFTAVVRTSLPHAPAFHIKAPVFGSGKSYLCEVIGAFAGPGLNSKVSYPATSEEATKTILSLLLTCPSVIEFDDMSSDWTPFGTIMRMLTAEQITDRILGASKTATVSTRTLFLGSGNNVGPVRDLLRRVLTIQIDPRCATPATITYRGNPLEIVRKERGKYVAAVLTIILAWRACGSPMTACDSIVTYSGAWSNYCRQPLIWLGYPDPASALIEQVKHDPDAEPLAHLMSEWFRAFGSIATTVRKAVETAIGKGFMEGDSELHDAIREFPVEERGVINRTKLGWILKKNANRIIDNMEFQRDGADGRTAWKVVKIQQKKPPASPDLPERPEFVSQEEPF
jgi:hypothetical protein